MWCGKNFTPWSKIDHGKFFLSPSVLLHSKSWNRQIDIKLEKYKKITEMHKMFLPGPMIIDEYRSLYEP